MSVRTGRTVFRVALLAEAVVVKVVLELIPPGAISKHLFQIFLVSQYDKIDGQVFDASDDGRHVGVCAAIY